MGSSQTQVRAWSVAGLTLAALIVVQGRSALQMQGLDLSPSLTAGFDDTFALLSVGMFLEAGRLTALAMYLRGLGAETLNRSVRSLGTFLAIGTPALFLINFMSVALVVIIHLSSRSDVFRGLNAGSETDWFAWFVGSFTMISVIVILLAGVFVMFRAWQGLGPRSGAVTRRSLT